MGGRRKGKGKWDSQGGGKGVKRGNIEYRYAIFCNQKNAKRREPTYTWQEPGLKGTGSRRFKHPCPPPPHTQDKQGGERLFLQHLIENLFKMPNTTFIAAK